MTSPQRVRRRGVRRIAGFTMAGVVLVGAGIAVLLSDGGDRLAGAALGAGAMAIAAAAVSIAKHLLPPPDETEERHAPGSPACIDCGHDFLSPRRRRFIAGGVVVAAAAATGGLLRRNTGAEEALRTTAWRRGDRLVTHDGRPIARSDLAVGAFLTVWPEGAVDVPDAQVVLLRVEPRSVDTDEHGSDGVAEGHLAYSRLCTHMGCPVGLFQQDPQVLICPCHQAVFDVFDGGRAVQGPARRSLPQLPLMVGDDGWLRAGGAFTDHVGPGWWGRPR